MTKKAISTSVIIYLHGFLSSPRSLKAQATAEFVARHYPEIDVYIPQLPSHPGPAQIFLESMIQKYSGSPLTLIGSSLGGYLCTYLIEKYGGRAVLINPAVRPYTLLADYLGAQQNPYTGEKFELHQSHMFDLKQLDVSSLRSPKAYKLLVQTDDEVLDYSEAVAKYQGASVTVEQGGNHSFVGFERYLPEIMEFLLK